jgi:asparagine synthase (glutamine-hydrolysing)
MNAAIAHRGPDNDGVYIKSNFGLGHRRLSIMDSSHLCHQPFRYKDFIITYNGEIYNHLEIKNDLQKLGYEFTTSGDTEIVLAAYDKWGENCVSHFEGMWSFIIYDPIKNILFGSRDRFGQKPFHYGVFNSYFIVASEIKQFFSVPGFRPSLNHKQAFNFLNYGALNYSDETLFEGIRSLPSGHNLYYDLSTHTYNITQWYFFPEKRFSKVGIHEAAIEFRRLLEKSIELRLGTDVRIGSCLSGGLDSSSIVCVMDQLIGSKKNFVTLSICWDDKSIDEQEYIDAVSDQTTSAINEKIFPNLDDLNQQNILDKVIYHQDQPILTTSHFAEYKVYEAAGQRGLRVVMDGQGADEYLGGYGVFNWYHMHGLFNASRFISLSKEWSAMRKSSDLRHHQIFKNLLYIKYKQRKPAMASFISEQWGSKHIDENPLLPPNDARLSAKYLSHHQVFTSSLPYQLHSADRNSMCHSVESRLPFLDHQLVEYCYLLQDTLKISAGKSKIVLREAMKGVLPEKVRERTTKLGFPAPENAWMLKNAKWIAKELDPDDFPLIDFVNLSKIKNDFNQFVKTGRGDQDHYFRILSFARWLKVFGVFVD